MTIRVAINGYGRIGRNIMRAHYESGKKHDACQKDLQAACKGLAIGKYCGMRHQH